MSREAERSVSCFNCSSHNLSGLFAALTSLYTSVVAGTSFFSLVSGYGNLLNPKVSDTMVEELKLIAKIRLAAAN